MKFGLIIGQTAKIGGMERQAALLARELRRRGHGAFLFVSTAARKDFGGRILDSGSAPRRYLYHTRWSAPLSRWLLRRYGNRDDIANWIAFNVESAEIALSAGIRGRIALSVRGTKFSTDPELAARYRSVASRCDLLVTNSDNTAEMLRGLGIAARGPTKVIRNGIELPEAKPCFDGKMVLYVGSLKPVKDPTTFVKACHKVSERDGETRVTIVGEGEMRNSIEAYLDDHGLRGRFVLTGEIPYESIPYKEASVFVNSSLRESSSNSLLEALSFGIPVVATANSGNSEIISRLGGHRLVSVSNVEEMADAIYSLMNATRELRLAIFRESRVLIEREYSVSRMVEGYIEAFAGF